MRCDDASTAMRGPSRRAGYSLLELVIVLIVVGLIMAIAVPSLDSAVDSTRLETARQALIGDLRLARTEAIRRNRTVEVRITGQTTYTIEYMGTRTLAEGARFSMGPGVIRFAPFGPLLTGMTTYVLRLEGEDTVIRVSASGNARADQ